MYEDDSHPCGKHECKNTVQFDDEPYCYTHSPDSGSSLPGYSYKLQKSVYDATTKALGLDEFSARKNTSVDTNVQ